MREGYDKRFASPADYDDGFVESDHARFEREAAIQANINRKIQKETQAKSESPVVEKATTRKTSSKPRITLSKQPITKHSSSFDDDLSDYYWRCSDSERESILKLMDEYGFSEDDYDDDPFKYEISERIMARPSKDKFDAISDFIEQTAHYDSEVQHSSMINTGRYLKINVYDKGLPDRTDGQYNDPYDKSNQPYAPSDTMIVYESVPNGKFHEFWRVDEPKSKSTVCFYDKNHFEIVHTLTLEESAKYEPKRNQMAYDQQVALGYLPKTVTALFAMRDQMDKQAVDDSVSNSIDITD